MGSPWTSLVIYSHLPLARSLFYFSFPVPEREILSLDLSTRVQYCGSLPVYSQLDFSIFITTDFNRFWTAGICSQCTYFWTTFPPVNTAAGNTTYTRREIQKIHRKRLSVKRSQKRLAFVYSGLQLPVCEKDAGNDCLREFGAYLKIPCWKTHFNFFSKFHKQFLCMYCVYVRASPYTSPH